LFTWLSFGSAQPSKVVQFSVGVNNGQPEQHANRGFAQGRLHRGLLRVMPALNECRPVRRPEMRMRCMDEMKECPAGAIELNLREARRSL